MQPSHPFVGEQTFSILIRKALDHTFMLFRIRYSVKQYNQLNLLCSRSAASTVFSPPPA
jgi:hypothetical protein